MNEEERAKIQVEKFLDHLERYGITLGDLVAMKKHLSNITGWKNWVFSLIKMLMVILLWEGLQHVTGWFNNV